jgi:hypothetical protein
MDDTVAVTNDPNLARLPAAAQVNFRKPQSIERRSRALTNGLAEAYDNARIVLANAEGELGAFDRRFRGLKDDDPKRLPLVKAIAEARAELRRISEDRAAVAAPGFSTDDLLGWVRSQPKTATFKFVAVSYRLKSGERPAEAMDDNRRAIALLRERIADINNAPSTRKEVGEAVARQVRGLIARGSPLIEPNGTINSRHRRKSAFRKALPWLPLSPTH